MKRVVLALYIVAIIGVQGVTANAQVAQPTPNSKLVIVDGQRAIAAIAKATHRSEAQVRAEMENVRQKFLQIDKGGVKPLEYGQAYRSLACYGPNTAYVYFYVGRGVVNLSYSGYFALSGGGSTNTDNTYWNCVQDICVLNGYANLVAGDSTTGFTIYNFVNTINITSYGCGVA